MNRKDGTYDTLHLFLDRYAHRTPDSIPQGLEYFITTSSSVLVCDSYLFIKAQKFAYDYSYELFNKMSRLQGLPEGFLKLNKGSYGP
jgi:hypothetical protein